MIAAPTPVWPPKEAHERLDFGADFRGDLLPGETASDFDAIVLRGTVQIDDVTEANGFVTVWISGGVKGELALVLVTLNTSGERTFTVKPVLPII